MTIGILIGVIPLTICLYINNSKYRDLYKKYKNTDVKSEYESTTTVYVLAGDMKKGEKISEKDLVDVKIKTGKKDIEIISKNEILDRELKIDAIKGTIVNSSILLEDEKINNDVRIHMFSDIELHSEILEGSLIDIRISFPNGEDYVLAGQKRIEKRQDDKILIYVDEGDILKISGARVDKNMYPGTRIYAILYAEDYQESAVPNYPVNLSVIELGNWNPNLVDKIFTEDMVNKRMVLEENLHQIDMGQVAE